MKKNGFTLVELLAVIVIMALLLTVAVPAVIGVSTRIRANMYCTKVEDIESAAKIYGENYKDIIEEKPDKTLKITVYNLIENNLYKKEDKDCDKAQEIQLEIKDHRVSAKYLGDKSDCNK